MKHFLFSVLVLSVMLSSSLVSGQTEKKHQIDIDLENALSKVENQTTAGMVQCESEAYDKWDKELNRLYGELKKKLNAEGQLNLKNAQIEWIKYRDLEFKNIDSIYAPLEGSMYVPMRITDRIRIVRNRVLELEGYLSLFDN